MLKIRLLILCFFLVQFSFGQNTIENLQMNLGTELKKDGYQVVKIIGETNEKIYGLALKGKKNYAIKTFSKEKMDLVSSNEISIPEVNGKDVDFEDIFMLNDKIYLIGSVYDSKNKNFKLTATFVNDKGILNTNSVELFSAEVENKNRRGDFYFKMSPDKKVILIMHTSLLKKEDAIKYELKLFDENMNNMFATSDKVKFDDDKKDYEFNIADFDVNYNDDVFVVINESYRDSKKKQKIELFELRAFKKSKNYAKEIINLDLKGNEVINCAMITTIQNVTKLVGFYSSVRENGKANKDLKGIYNISINNVTNKIDNIRFNEFDYPTKVKLIGERRANKGKDVKPLYYTTTIIETDEGGLIILSEYQDVFYGPSQGIGPLSFRSLTYKKNEIIVTHLNPDGTLKWQNVIPKEQEATITTMSIGLAGIGTSGNFTVGVSIQIPIAQLGSGPEYLGAMPFYSDGKLSVLINDNAKNKGITNIEDIRSMGNPNNAVPSLFIFDSNGNITRKDPEEVIKQSLVIRPAVYYRKTSKEYLTYLSRKAKESMGRLILIK